MSKTTSSILVYLKLLMTAVFWGGTFIAGRAISSTVGPFSAALMRFIIASACLLWLTKTTEGRFPRMKRSQIVPVLLLGVSGIFAYNAFFFKGLQHIEASRASLIIANNPILIALFSAIFFKERLTPLKIVGILLSVSGAVVVITKGQILTIFQESVGMGELYIFGCVVSWVAYSLIGKIVLRRLSPLQSVTCAVLAGSAMLLFPAYREGIVHQLPRYGWLEWGSFAYLGICGTVLGFVWYYQGIQAIGPTKAGLFINFVPVSAILLAFFLLDEPITSSLIFGGLLVSSGVYLTNKRTKKPLRE
jgi:drug/metabolite transporter (DMT)-like permease